MVSTVHAGVTVISGLARGIDGVAHETALQAQGRTIAVLGGSLDWIYPAEHRGLAHRICENGALVTEYPTPELRMLVNRWERDYERRMEELSDRYRQHFESIKAELPPTAVELVENGLHDAVVLSVERPSEDQLVLTLDCSGGFHYFTDVRFTFEGVTYSNVPADFKGAWWLYDEIYKTEDGFELHTLFDSPMSETVIRARDVKIEPLKLPLMRRLKKWYRRR